MNHKVAAGSEYNTTHRFAIGGGDGGVAAFDVGDDAVDPGLAGVLKPHVRADDDVHRSPLHDRSSGDDRGTTYGLLLHKLSTRQISSIALCSLAS